MLFRCGELSAVSLLFVWEWMRVREGERERESGACARVTTLVESEPELSITRKRENPRTRKSWSAGV